MPKGQPAMSVRAMREDWCTPDSIFAPLHAEFQFTLDGAATAENAKLPRFSRDAFSEYWGNECVWLNPPYGHLNLMRWMKRAYLGSRFGATVVCLVPSHTGQKWWQEYATKANEVRWIPGKITFVGAANCAPFYSAVLVFRPSC